jgi:ABC-type transport system involved in multi-copper enzyme maturation permease subunit
MNPARILALSRLVLSEHVRDRLLWLGAVVAIVLAAGLRGVEWLNFGLPRARFLVDGALAAASLTGLLLAVGAATQGMQRHTESGLAALFIARGVGRAEIIVGHWFAVAGLLAGFLLLFGVVLAGALAGLGETMARELATGLALVWLRGAVVAAIALALAATTTSLTLALCLVLMVAAAGYLRDVLGAGVAANGWLEWALAAVPDLSVFDLDRGHAALAVLAYGAAHGVLWIGLSIAVFRKREL